MEETRIQKDRDTLDLQTRNRREAFVTGLDLLATKIDQIKIQYTSFYQTREANDVVDKLAKSL